MRSWHLFPLAIALMVAWGCGDDEPTGPARPRDPVIEFPGDTDTLQDAIDMASAGDTVRVAGGTYALDASIQIGVDQAGIVIESAPAAARGEETEPVLDFDLLISAGAIIVAPEATGVVIRGITIRGTYAEGIRIFGTGAVVTGCRIEGAHLDAVYCEGMDLEARVEGNLLLGSGRFGVNCRPQTRVEIVQNTIVDTGDCGIYTIAAAPRCERNIVARSPNFGFACFTSPDAVLDCNVVHGSQNADYSAGCVPGSNDQQTDPLLCGDGTYGVEPGSPCADTMSECGWIGAVEVVCTER